MPIEEDINGFKKWAISLGCPFECLPNDEALTKLFRSGESIAFSEVMDLVRPRQEVNHIRQNILVDKISKSMGSFMTMSAQASLPKEMTNYLAIERLTKKIEETESRISDSKAQCDSLQKEIKEKNIKQSQLSHELHLKRAKYGILKLKVKSLSKSVAKENELNSNVQQIMPVQYEKRNNFSHDIVDEAMEEATEAIRCFNKIFDREMAGNNFNSTSAIQAKNDLWKTLRRIFQKYPNFLLFNSLIRNKDEQLQTISVFTNQDGNSSSLNVSNGPISKLNIGITRGYAKHIENILELKKACRREEILQSEYLINQDIFSQNILQKMEQFNCDMDIDEQLISDYITEYSIDVYNQGLIQFLQRKIKEKQDEIKERSVQLEDHQILMTSLQQTYSEIDQIWDTINHDFMALTQVKEKLRHSKELITNIVQNGNFNPQQGLFMNNTLPNSSMIHSFNASDDSVLCSTKLAMDNTLRSAPAARPNQRVQLPQHISELQLFLRIPIDKLSPMSIENSMLLEENFLKINHKNTYDSNYLLELLPHHLLVPQLALNEIRQQLQWHDKLRATTIYAKTDDIKLPQVNEAALKENISRQVERMYKLIDQTTERNANTLRTFEQIEKYYKLLMNYSSIGRFIPNSLLFNSRNYQEYYQEFLLHYSMIKNAQK